MVPQLGGAKSRKTKEKQGKTMKNKEKQAMSPRAHARMHSRAH